MALTYGYDLKDNDDMIAAPVQATGIMSQLILPGAAMVNHLPFCAFFSYFIPIMLAPHDYLQCGTFLHGSHGSATNH